MEAKAYEIWFKRNKNMEDHFVFAVPVDWTFERVCMILGLNPEQVEYSVETEEQALDKAAMFCDIQE